MSGQSSTHQVLHNRESSALQYAMRDRLIALGWSEIRSRSTTISAARRQAASPAPASIAWWRNVCLGKVGAVAAREVSRFARNSRDWQQLIEMCRVVDTVLIDQEAVYAPRQGNDRLLLGLKAVSTSTNSTCCASARSPHATRRGPTWRTRRGRARRLRKGW